MVIPFSFWVVLVKISTKAYRFRVVIFMTSVPKHVEDARAGVGIVILDKDDCLRMARWIAAIIAPWPYSSALR